MECKDIWRLEETYHWLRLVFKHNFTNNTSSRARKGRQWNQTSNRTLQSYRCKKTDDVLNATENGNWGKPFKGGIPQIRKTSCTFLVPLKYTFTEGLSNSGKATPQLQKELSGDFWCQRLRWASLKSKCGHNKSLPEHTLPLNRTRKPSICNLSLKMCSIQ